MSELDRIDAQIAGLQDQRRRIISKHRTEQEKFYDRVLGLMQVAEKLVALGDHPVYAQVFAEAGAERSLVGDVFPYRSNPQIIAVGPPYAFAGSYTGHELARRLIHIAASGEQLMHAKADEVTFHLDSKVFFADNSYDPSGLGVYAVVSRGGAIILRLAREPEIG